MFLFIIKILNFLILFLAKFRFGKISRDDFIDFVSDKWPWKIVTNYKFSCDWNLTYIGESKLRLESRINLGPVKVVQFSNIFKHALTILIL